MGEMSFLGDNRVVYMHISDLLYPQNYGLTTMQYIIISKMIDTKLWIQGMKPKWHIIWQGIMNKLSVMKMNVVGNMNPFLIDYKWMDFIKKNTIFCCTISVFLCI